ncbi:putative ribonuclease H-like domain-containing protein, partial [Tanacetum coccineum]
FSWVFFLATKDETSGILKTFITGIENQINNKVKIIKCDNGSEFKNNDMNQFCRIKGIKTEFSIARTPQQNGVAERKNKTLIEAAKTMLADSLLPTTFWAEAVITACYVHNMVLVTKPHIKTPYELLHGRPPSISFMRPFGCPVNILNTLDPLGKFDKKVDEGFFVRYSINSKAFKVFNTRTRKVEENLHITFLENKPNVAGSRLDWLFDIYLLTNSMNYKPVTTRNQTNKNAGIKDNVDEVPTQQYILLPLLYDSLQSSEDAVDDDAGKKTNGELANEGERNGQEKDGGASNKEDDQNVQDFRAALDNYFNNADDLPNDPLMPDLEDTGIFSGQLHQKAEENKSQRLSKLVIFLFSLTNRTQKGKHAIRTKWVYRNKKDERGIVVRNKARLVSQVAFLYGTIKEEVYVYQPPGFEDPQFPDKVYKVEKSLYGLHKAPRAWYETLSTYLLENRFRRRIINKTLFIKKDKGDILLVQVYVDASSLDLQRRLQVKQKDDGIFINQDKYVADILKKFNFVIIKTTSTPIETNKVLLKDEETEDVDVHLYRSMIGSLMYLTTSRPDIMFTVCACARFQVTPKVSHLHIVKRIFRYLKRQPKLGLWYPRDSPFDLEAFSDSDYAGASLDWKSTIGGCQFLGKRLISWQCKKHTIVANSTTEAEYVAAANCCRQSFYQKTRKPRKAKRTTKISQSSRPIHLVADETVYKEWEDRMERAATIASSLEAEQDSGNINRTQSMATLNEPLPQGTGSGSGPRCQVTILGGAEAQTRFEAASKQSNDPPLSRVNTLGSGEDSMKLKELMELCTMYCDQHNMVALLEKTDRSEGFHQIVDFLNASHIRFALSENPTIYDSYIKQFWQTATVNTLDNGEQEITATVNGHVKTVTIASVRKYLQLADAGGLSSLPNTKFFDQLSLMGYALPSDKLTFQKGHFSPQWKFMIHTILHCLSPKKTAWEQFSSNIATAIICLATNRTFNFSKLIFDGMVKNLDNQSKFLMYPRFIQIFLNKRKRLLSSHKRIYITPTLTPKLFSNMRRVTKGYSGASESLFVHYACFIDQTGKGEGSTIPAGSNTTPLMAPSTEPHPEHRLNHLLLNHIHHPHKYLNYQLLQQLGKLSDRKLRFLSLTFLTQILVADEAAFTGVDVVHGGAATTVSSIDAGWGSGNITKSPTMPHDLPLPEGYTPGSDEGSMPLHELMVLCINLSNKVKSLETELKQTKQAYGAAFTKLIKKVKKLEQTVKTSQARRRTKIIASDDEEDLVAEDPSKQGRSMIEEMDLDAGISLVPPHVEVQGRYGQNLDTQEDTTADDLTLAETLMEIRKSAAKAKGKAKMDETESPRKMKQREQVQISRDAEVAQKLQEEFDASGQDKEWLKVH